MYHLLDPPFIDMTVTIGVPDWAGRSVNSKPWSPFVLVEVCP